MSIFTYRFLQPDEVTKVDPIFKHFDWHRPEPRLGTFAVAEDPDGNIKALLTLQMVAHVEPLYCSDPSVNLFQLREMIEDVIKDSGTNIGPGYVAIATNEDAERAAIANGMSKVEGTIYRKELV